MYNKDAKFMLALFAKLIDAGIVDVENVLFSGGPTDATAAMEALFDDEAAEKLAYHMSLLVKLSVVKDKQRVKSFLEGEWTDFISKG